MEQIEIPLPSWPDEKKARQPKALDKRMKKMMRLVKKATKNTFSLISTRRDASGLKTFILVVHWKKQNVQTYEHHGTYDSALNWIKHLCCTLSKCPYCEK